MSMRAFSEKSGVATDTINRAFKDADASKLYPSTYRAIAAACDLTPEQLDALWREPSPRIPKPESPDISVPRSDTHTIPQRQAASHIATHATPAGHTDAEIRRLLDSLPEDQRKRLGISIKGKP